LKQGGINSKAPWLTIVGVVANVKQYALDTNSRVAFYSPHEQVPAGGMYVAVRTTGDPRRLAAAITDEARAMDANVPVFDVKTMQQRLSESLARRRFAMLALGLFAVVAMLLAAVGIYGVMSYTVTQRTREIGIRMALGATRGNVSWLILREVVMLALVGLIVGLPAAYGLGRVTESLLFGVTASDPLVFVAAGLLLSVATLVGGYLPARKAASIDPLTALRYE
jgi:ABC-type lipoprotein release transport system permease subunit